jgi:hypothetical protein
MVFRGQSLGQTLGENALTGSRRGQTARYIIHNHDRGEGSSNKNECETVVVNLAVSFLIGKDWKLRLAF